MPAKRRTTTSGRRSRSGAREISNFFDRLEWRCAGPYRGGRVGAVAGDPRERNTFYFGSTGGGVWKTMDGGVYWENTTDRFFKRASVGGIAVAESDPDVMYVGMGESCIRGNVSHGDGVYRSTDAGKTWSHLGLERTRNIAKVRVHPDDADTVYVAALGHAHGPNPERGVYRSRDGGKTWKRVLYRNEKAGASDLSIDPNNPRIIYASFWEAIRRPWELVSGGPGSGLFRSTDGGDTWKEISHNKGLPKGMLGKIGVSASAAKSGRVYAIVEAEDGAVFRSDDFGETWDRGGEDRNLRQRAWYYHHIYAHPTDPETVWVLNVSAWRSDDGGKTFQELSIPHGDHHDLWVDPKDPSRIINGNDGGAVITLNGGESWSSVYNQPTAEFYHVITDNQTPYRIYGAQQDNTTMTVPSRAPIAGIPGADSFAIGGGESGYIAVRADDPNIVFAGNYQGILTRYDRRTGQSRNIMVWPESSSGEGAGAVRYRFQWTAPIVHSPHDPNVLYTTGNHVFRTTDDGATWERISPDLTRNDATKLGPSGGPITKDNTGAEYYCTIFAFAESPVAKGVLWAGSDDGLIHAATEPGVYVSSGAGGRGRRRGATPPAVPIHDMVVKDSDLVLATHGRSFWVLDDLSPIRQLAAGGLRGRAHLFAPRPTVRFRTDFGFPQPPKLGKNYRMTGATIVTYRQVEKPTGEKAQVNIDAGQNPPDGVLVSYWLGAKPEGDVTLTFLDAKAGVIRSFKSAPPEPKETKEEKPLTPEQKRSEEIKKAREPKVPKEAGLNRFVWNMRQPDATRVEDDPTWESAEATLAGPVCAPGQYRVRLEAGGERHEISFEIRKDPRVPATQADFDAQFALRLGIRDKLSEVHEAINAMRALRGQIEGWEKRAEGTGGAAKLKRAASALKTKIASAEEELIQVKAKSRQDTLNYPAKLNLKIGGLAMAVGSADFAPTKAMQDVFADLGRRSDAQLAKWRQIAKTDVPAFDKLVRGSGVPAVAAIREKREARRPELRRAAAH